MGVFKAPKVGSHSSELIVGRLTGVMDLKIFYKGKNRGEESGMRPESLKLSRNIREFNLRNFIVSVVIRSFSDFNFRLKFYNKHCLNEYGKYSYILLVNITN